jgi:chaperonin GroEL
MSPSSAPARAPHVTRPSVVGQPFARAQFLSGIALLTEMLAATLGPSGGPVASYDNERRVVETFDDAATALRRIISLGRPDLDVGAMLVRNAIWRLEQRVGDGGAATAVLLRALVESGARQVAAGANAMRLAEGMRRGMDAALDALRAQAQPAGDERRLALLARSLMRDDDLAAVLGELSFLLGPDGHLQIETYVAPYLQRSYIAGAHYPARIASMYFYGEGANAVQRRAVLAAPAVALVDEPLKQTEQVLPLLEGALAAGRSALLIVAPEISGAALSLLVANHTLPADKRKLSLLAVSLKASSEERRWALPDLALISGASVLGPDHLREAASARAGDLGSAPRAEFADGSLVVTMEPGRRAAVQGVIGALRARLAGMDADDPQRPALVRQLATLAGGIGVLKIGALSQPERDLRKTQAERGWKVLAGVQRGGVVAGGGAALLHCAPAVRAPAAEEPEADVALGARVLADALDAPLRRIMVNAGVAAPAVWVQRLAECGAPFAYDALAGRIVHAPEAGLLDAAEVVAAALEAAVSAATMALTTDAIVYHRKPEQAKPL